MIDATALFEKAKGKKGSWSRENTLRVLSRIRDKITDSLLDWEDDESWGRIIIGKNVAVIVHATFPIVIAAEPCADAARDATSEFDVAFASVPSFDNPCLSADKEKLEMLLSRTLSECA